jgi:hypothetical protein
MITDVEKMKVETRSESSEITPELVRIRNVT